MDNKAISKEKYLEELLHYKNLVESADSAIIARDLNDIIISWNKSAEELFQYTSDEMVGKPFSLLVPKKNKYELGRIKRLVTKGIRIEDYETVRVKKNGEEVNILAKISPLINQSGRVVGITVFDRDNTEKKKQREKEQFLAKAQKIMFSTLKYDLALKKLARLLVPYLADWSSIHIVDENGVPVQLTIAHIDPKKVKWAEKLQKKIKREPNDPQNATYRVIKSGKSEIYPLITDEMVKKTVKNKEDRDLILELQLKSLLIVPLISGKKVMGVITLVSTDEKDLYDKSDLAFIEELGRMAGQAIDNARLYKEAKAEIANRIKIENDLRSSERKLRTILETVDDGITVFDENAKVVYANTSISKASGYETVGGMLKKPIKWKNIFKVFGEDGQPISVRELPGRKAIYAKRKVEKVIKSVNKKTGEEKWAIVKGSPIMDELGNVTGSVSVTHDITQRQELERRKDDFIGIASHELKTPITSIKGFVHLLKKDHKGYDKSYSFLDRIDKQLDKLTELIEDLLDISKIQSGKIEYRLEEFDIGELVKEVVSDLRSVEKHRIILRNGVRKKIIGDRERISQVLINLINNAAKYSPNSDKVEVILNDLDGSVRVDVKDYGIGISKDEMDKIFERFYRVKDIKGKTFPGLGIGLYLSREIVMRHHGKLWVDSKKGEGSTFHFKLPAN
ncbi:MAG TPA: PAS domain S-box protein [Patescibacteria group bacterium]|nr:PAS domain S-box protein [Patescibacteria group bacterium]